MKDKHYFVGIDAGTSYTKAVLINAEKKVLSSFVKRTGISIEDSSSDVFKAIISAISLLKSDISHITATGYGKSKVSFANTYKTEISCHAKGAYHYFPRKITIIDIGGQDTKVIKLDNKGKIIKFKMNRKCAAGTGAFIEEIAYQLDIPLNELNNLAAKSVLDVPLASYCTVFAKTEILSRIKQGERIEDLLKSVFGSVIKRVIEMAELEGTIILTGGVVAHNSIIGEILKNEIKLNVLTPPNPQFIGAFGAALFSREKCSLNAE